ncbi:MAG: GIY-YIG nuclease family protein [Pseudomonadota bacterium]
MAKTIQPDRIRRIRTAETARRVKGALLRAESEGLDAAAFLEHRTLPDEVAALRDDVDADADAATESASPEDAETGFVYACGFPGYPDRLKIGRTQGGVEARVTRQASGASAPDHPVIALRHETPDSDALERSLHARLHLHGRWISTPGGKEGFRVSEAERLALIRLAETALSTRPEAQPVPP